MKVIVLLSGGLDSTVLMYHYLALKDTEVKAISIDYGQRHRKELHAAEALCEDVGVEWVIVELHNLRGVLAGSSLTSSGVTVPDGHYADDNMKITVVPNRNMILLSVALGWCISQKFDAVAYAAHAGDHTIYADCRPVFADVMHEAAWLCSDEHPDLLTPFIRETKADIVRRGATLEVPFEKTWSCYKGRSKHCGKCGTCVERIEAFELAEVSDHTVYA